MKQVIVIRKDLNMRKGKMVAQGAHASAKVIAEQFDRLYDPMRPKTVASYAQYDMFREWLDGLQKKVCVGVESEEELHQLYAKAKSAMISCSIVLDAGLTEFGQPTYTAIAVGPDEDEVVDQITGGLKLL